MKQKLFVPDVTFFLMAMLHYFCVQLYPEIPEHNPEDIFSVAGWERDSTSSPFYGFTSKVRKTSATSDDQRASATQGWCAKPHQPMPFSYWYNQVRMLCYCPSDHCLIFVSLTINKLITNVYCLLEILHVMDVMV